MLNNVKKLYGSFRFQDILFMAFIASTSIFAAISVVIVQLGSSMSHMPNIFYLIAIFPLFASILFLLMVFKPNVHLRNSKKALLVFGVIFSFIIIYVIL